MFSIRDANAVFLRLEPGLIEALRGRGWRFYTFIGGGARFMFAWDAEQDRVRQLARDLRGLVRAEAA